MAAHVDMHERIRGSDFALPLVTAVGSIRSRSAQRLAWHSHEGFELIFLLEGGTSYQFHEHGLRSLRGGQFLLVPAGTLHRGKQDIRMPSVLCGIVFEPRRKGGVRNSTFTAADLHRMAKEFAASPPAVRSMNRELKALVTRLADLVRAYRNGDKRGESKSFLRATICMLIGEAARLLKTRERADATTIAATAEAFLRTHHADGVQMPELARHLGLSRARMHEVFKTATGLAPNDFLQRHRIEIACEMLAGSQRTVTDVAMETGFSSSQYFSKVFLKYCGMTPSAYRTARKEPAAGSQDRAKR